MRLRAPGIALACIEALEREIPEYAEKWLTPAQRAAAVESARRAIERDVGRLGVTETHQAARLADFRHRGRLACRRGLSRESVQAAVRVANRVVWREIADAARECGCSADVLYQLAEGMFADVETSMAAIAEGYTAAELAASGDGQRHRALLRALIDGRVPADVDGFAAAAGLTLPDRVAVVAFRAGPGAPDFPAGLIPAHVLADPGGPGPVLLSADPETDLAGLGRLPRGWIAAVGPRVGFAEAAESYRIALRAAELAERGLLGGTGPVVWCREHVTKLLLLADEFLLARLAEQTLAPLAGVGGHRREQLADTLLALVRTRGSAPELGRQLDLHPQTVRGRLKKLGELFGDRLEDPDERLRLELSLLAEKTLAI
ncbi:helix-turn-helix domain-containing protein [Amycolatopsis sp. PS_44_ISF1]|uniref:helix-turn-helix domain-containing protein n=1 Tax=Amycolatopsis sp. PS_44_ISF1 TaxID=2974917 RepID=UPI0028DE1733|nr:helix-turn-helix domain-containing protein [Amycolatopsis sp. PS_44_ISF1]MDT8912963.1 helix-turn-helix domain-containing protein [Amycolatopsis sp. PS_44_ISF1]